MGCVKYDDARPFSQPAAGHPQIGLLQLREYGMRRWGGEDLGIYNNRAIVGSSKPSIHRDGRAWDWRAPSRAKLEEFWAFLLENNNDVALNIQEIHDYAKGRLWRTCQGWRSGNIGVGAGGAYTHVERNWAGALDTRLISQIVGSTPGTPTPVPPTEVEVWVQERDIQPGETKTLTAPIGAKSMKARVYAPDQKPKDSAGGANVWAARNFDNAKVQGLWANGTDWELWAPPLFPIDVEVPDTARSVTVQNKGPLQVTLVLSGT